MKKLLLLAALLAACSAPPEPKPVRVSCVTDGVSIELTFDRVEKTDAGLRAWKFGESAILQAECVVVE